MLINLNLSNAKGKICYYVLGQTLYFTFENTNKIFMLNLKTGNRGSIVLDPSLTKISFNILNDVIWVIGHDNSSSEIFVAKILTTGVMLDYTTMKMENLPTSRAFFIGMSNNELIFTFPVTSEEYLGSGSMLYYKYNNCPKEGSSLGLLDVHGLGLIYHVSYDMEDPIYITSRAIHRAGDTGIRMVSQNPIMTFLTDNGFIFLGDIEGNIGVYDAANDKALGVLMYPYRYISNNDNEVTCLVLHEKYLFVAHANGNIFCWDVSSLRDMPDDDSEEAVPIRKILIAKSTVFGINVLNEILYFSCHGNVYPVRYVKMSTILEYTGDNASIISEPDGIVANSNFYGPLTFCKYANIFQNINTSQLDIITKYSENLLYHIPKKLKKEIMLFLLTFKKLGYGRQNHFPELLEKTIVYFIVENISN